MTAEVPTIEPESFIAGDTWQWTRSLADYPASTWTLTYRARSREGEFSITASASGSDHSITVAKATTAAYKAGLYAWIAQVTDGTTRTTVASGLWTVAPDPASTGAGFDPRSHARKVLEAIEAIIEGRATKSQLEYSIGGRSVKHMTHADLLVARSRYASEVAAEDRAAAIARGLGVAPSGIRVRF